MGDGNFGDAAAKTKTAMLIFSAPLATRCDNVVYAPLGRHCPLYQKPIVQRNKDLKLVIQWQWLQKRSQVPEGLMCMLQGPSLRGSQGKLMTWGLFHGKSLRLALQISSKLSSDSIFHLPLNKKIPADTVSYLSSQIQLFCNWILFFPKPVIYYNVHFCLVASHIW